MSMIIDHFEGDRDYTREVDNLVTGVQDDDATLIPEIVADLPPQAWDTLCRFGYPEHVLDEVAAAALTVREELAAVETELDQRLRESESAWELRWQRTRGKFMGWCQGHLEERRDYLQERLAADPSGERLWDKLRRDKYRKRGEGDEK